MHHIPPVVTCFNGARDRYEVPLALHEIALLRCHVTDFFVPYAVLRTLGLAKSRLSARSKAGLPASKTKISWSALARNSNIKVFGLKDSGQFFDIDEALSHLAGRMAAELGADMFIHSGYAFRAFNIARERFKVLFQYHPLPLYMLDALQRDYDRYPWMKWSFEVEKDTRPATETAELQNSEWCLADHIFCASTFTKRSLIHVGARADLISVIPYGVTIPNSLGTGSDITCSPPARKRIRFLFVGQALQRKGIHHLLEAWREIDGKLDAELTVVSRRIDPGLASRLTQKNITVRSDIRDADLESIYQQSDVLVMPSIVEGFGLVYLEALAHGLLCIGTQTTGLPDIDCLSAARIVIPHGDIEALTDAILEAARRIQTGDVRKPEIVDSVRHLSWSNHRKQLGIAYCDVRTKARTIKLASVGT